MLSLIPELVLAISLGQASAEPANDQPPKDSPADEQRSERLEFMKKSAAVYELVLAADPHDGTKPGDSVQAQLRPAKAALEAEPLLRWSNIEGNDDGTLFLWTAAGRPVAAAQAFSVNRGKLWLHEFQSLWLERFSLNRDEQKVWTPAKAGVAFQRMPGAATPAKTASHRATQMREMARLFTVSDDYGNAGNIWQLRLLSQPVYRYPQSNEERIERQEAGNEVFDGALFAFVVGTDPEMLLLFEARRETDGDAWHYALAPMTAFALKVSLSGEPVWSCPFRGSRLTPRDPFFTLEYKP